jgi:quercetin dioxygenase-like cupin family protein
MGFAIRLILAALPLTGAAPALAGQATVAIPSIVSTPLLRTTTTWDGVKIVYSKTESPEIQSVLVEIAPGAATAWHLHPVNNVAYIIEGRVRLELENGTTHEFKAGEAFAEVVNTWHRGVNIGSGPLRILVVYAGEVGTPSSIPKGGKPGE